MLRLKTLTIENFRSFKDKAEILFPEKGAVLISGSKPGTEISSGTGKSSILMAIAYALGYCSLPATELKNRYAGKTQKMRVTLSLADDTGAAYSISRDPALKLSINGEEYAGLSKGAEEKLAEILRMSPDFVEALTYREQRVPGRFVNSTDSELKSFLSDLLNVGKFEQASDLADKAFATTENAIQTKAASLQYLQQNLESTGSVSEVELREAENAYAKAKVRVESLMSADQQRNQIQLQISKLRIEISNQNTTLRQASAKASESASLKNQIVRLAAEAKDLRDAVCPTCKREWDKAAAEAQLREQQARELYAKIKTNDAVIAAAKPLEESVQQLQQEVQKLEQQCGTLAAPLADAQQAFKSAKAHLSLVYGKIETAKKLEAQKAEAQAEIQALRDVQPLNAHISKIFSRTGFMSVIFDEVLAEIESTANNMLEQIPNVAGYSVRIASAAITKSGTVKNSITVKLMKDGESVSIKSLSGGQKCALELSTDLAVATVIRRRAGSTLAWICLDEAMDGLDIESKRSALAVIKTQIDGQIIVVDHSTEVKEGFEAVIEVVYDGKTSSIT